MKPGLSWPGRSGVRPVSPRMRMSGFSRAHISHISTPFAKTPREVCTANGHYDLLGPDRTFPAAYLPRSNHKPALRADQISRPHPRVCPGERRSPVTDFYRFLNREMLSQSGERTLLSCIIPPGTGHVNTCFGIAFENTEDLVRLAGMSQSLTGRLSCENNRRRSTRDKTFLEFPVADHERARAAFEFAHTSAQLSLDSLRGPLARMLQSRIAPSARGPNPTRASPAAASAP